MSVNKVLLIGNVGKDPEVRTMPDGTSVANITLATSERYKDRNGEQQQKTEWHTITAWAGLADLVQKHVRKGQQLYVEGKLHTRSYDGTDGVKRYVTEINAENIQFIGPKREDQPQQSDGCSSRPMRNQPPMRQRAASPVPAEGSDDLPF